MCNISSRRRYDNEASRRTCARHRQPQSSA